MLRDISAHIAIGTAKLLEERDKHTITWAELQEARQSYISNMFEDVFIPYLDMPVWVEDPTTCCPRCKDTFFSNGCPHCGNTFLSREILRQTF